MELIIRNAKAYGHNGLVDIGVENGTILEVSASIAAKGDSEIDAQGYFVSPGLIDLHTHIDKCLISDRFPADTDREALSARILNSRQIKLDMSIEDIRSRAAEFYRMAVCNGTTMTRTFVEADRFIGMKAVDGLLQVKQELAHLMDLQTIAFAQEGWYHTPGTYEEGCEEYLIKALERGVDIIGGNINATVWKSRPEDQIDRMFEIAKQFNCDIDMHIDNADDGRAFSLAYLAEKTLREQYQGRVAAGHAVGIAHVPDDIAFAAMDRVREAGISIVVLPTRMKLTRVKDFLRHGVNVVLGTDNIRDVFVYLGNADMIETMLLLARILNVGSDAELEAIYQMGTVNAARAARLTNYGIQPDCSVDLVIFKAHSVAETIITQARRLYVLKHGKIVAQDGELVR